MRYDLKPLASVDATNQPRPVSRHPCAVDAAYRQVDAALDRLCDTLGLARAT